MALEDYKDLIGSLAAVTTIAQFFSPCIICYDIIKKKSTKDVQVTPFIGGMAMSLLMLQHGLMLNDSAMIPVNIVGFILNLVYFIIYYNYSNEQSELLSKCGKALIGVAFLIAYTKVESQERAETIFGLVVTVLLLCLIASPLASLGEVISTQSTASLPFPLILSGSVVTFLWFLYGFIINNIFILIQNSIGFILCAIQLSLFVIYPSSSKKLDKKE